MQEVQQCILNYFHQIFTSSRPLPEDIQSGTEHLPGLVDPEMAEDLQRPYIEIEVTKALFSMSPLKSPGPDGMPPIFYQKFWHVVKSDVISCVLALLNQRILPEGLNATNIMLIPKSNRLKPWLDRIISPSQSAFVSRRLITDNVLLAFETNHFLHTHSKGRKHFMNLKLDISKAYDKVEWPFLRTVLESLSSLFRVAEARGTVPGVAVCCGAPRISHLLFADDTMKQLAEDLGIRLDTTHAVYLGLPALALRSKRTLFAALKDRIWRRIQGWHEKSLSQAGKAVLIQVVVQAIPSYSMSSFWLPKTLLQEFHSMAANFFWHDGDRRRIHWLAWKHLCRASLGARPSYTWRSLMAAMELVRVGCRWCIETGRSVLIWHDPWLPRVPTFRIITLKPGLDSVVYVSDLIQADTREWDVELIRALFWQVDCEAILQIALSYVGGHDFLDLVGMLGTGVYGTRFGKPKSQTKLSSSSGGLPGTSFHLRAIYRRALSRKLSTSNFNLAALVCWTVWWSRNLKMANLKFLLPLQVIEFARSYLDAFSLQSRVHGSVRPLFRATWQPPPPLCVKLNFDGGTLCGGHGLGVGITARDAAGNCLAWLSLKVDRVGSC
ncbi:UNVERIFIED_CONTAM: hypothetical protein Slati_3729900 [Sesamum latifolium]|uniref:Reverse transcriptase domain-containing protein n=1 Tax=Sesamum latifolium TaxID=2727402 RepID=A0AAW2U3H0_9LAMI